MINQKIYEKYFSTTTDYHQTRFNNLINSTNTIISHNNEKHRSLIDAERNKKMGQTFT